MGVGFCQALQCLKGGFVSDLKACRAPNCRLSSNRWILRRVQHRSSLRFCQFFGDTDASSAGCEVVTGFANGDGTLGRGGSLVSTHSRGCVSAHLGLAMPANAASWLYVALCFGGFSGWQSNEGRRHLSRSAWCGMSVSQERSRRFVLFMPLYRFASVHHFNQSHDVRVECRQFFRRYPKLRAG